MWHSAKVDYELRINGFDKFNNKLDENLIFLWSKWELFLIQTFVYRPINRPERCGVTCCACVTTVLNETFRLPLSSVSSCRGHPNLTERLGITFASQRSAESLASRRYFSYIYKKTTQTLLRIIRYRCMWDNIFRLQ